MAKKIVGVLFGGRSGEYEVSLKSANTIATNFDQEQYEVVPIAIGKDGKWFGPIPVNDILSFTPENYQQQQVVLLPQPGGILFNLVTGEEVVKLDVVFPIIHGTYGEDGIIQGLLELADIPYVGPRVAGSAVGMDKLIMKKILAYHDFPQVAFCDVERGELEKDIKEVVEMVKGKLNYPLFIKPANAGSSVGISKAKNDVELEEGLLFAAKYDRKVVVEEGLNIREIEISVLGNEHPKASLPGEIIPSNEFYDYNAKYIDNKSVEVIPAQLSEDMIKQIQQMAVEIFKALECSGLARVDFFVTKDTEEIYINEINTLPGFTSISMYPKLWAATGLPMDQLLDQLVNLGIELYNEKNKNSIDL